jgi:Oxidoreductase molybdopterin binding domain
MNDKQRPAVRPDEVRRDLENLDRRLFLRGSLSLGALSLLTGCDLSTDDSVDNALRAMLRLDDPSRPPCSIRTSSQRPIRPARSRVPFASTRTTRNGRCARWKHHSGAWRYRAWLTIGGRGLSPSCAHCRRKSRSHGMSVWKAGVRSANGAALHPQTILTLDFEQKPLEPPWGAPLRLRIPTKLGFKNPKYITSIAVTNHYPGGYWEDKGYNWFSGL